MSRVRPYLLTGGRVRPIGMKLNMAAQVVATRDGLDSTSRLHYEHRDIVEFCREWVAIAEISAHVGLHLGVTRVLVADLIALNFLTTRGLHLPEDRQRQIIERVIRGLTAIR
ncbi:DUF742 domain-containing protein [Micromonospora sp. ALFpr18c]|uniref:DUF742 domain-containing protein n=2 Tax=Micromonospora TaxID=1873 RepID=UPI001788CD03